MSDNTGTIRGSVTPRKIINGNVRTGSSVSSGEVSRNTGGIKSYNRLDDKPQVNGEELIGNKSSEELHIAAVKTTAQWAELTTLVSVKGEVYVYSDYATDENNNPIPAIKVGDGLAYVVDLPFVTASDARITAEDIANWNNKVAVQLNGENLIFY